MNMPGIGFLALLLSAGALLSPVPCTGAVDRTSYPDADSVVLEEKEHVGYNPDGTYESVSEYWTKILTEKGRREESTITISYSKRYGEAAIVYVGAVDANGAEREIDVAATTKESTDNSSMSANIYDPLDRKITCTVPGLKVGETVHVKIVRKTFKSRIENHWADISILEWKSPILKSVYEVKAPAGLPVKAKAVRNPLGNVIESEKRLEDGSTLYVFTATNSPQMFPEPDMPPAYTQVQNVRLSTASDWREISRWYWRLCLPHLEKTNSAMTNKVHELKGSLAGEELVANIFKFVSQEIRYMGLTMEDTSPGYAPHDVDITFNNRYGVCRDKAGLLVAMLRIAGIEAFPVLINVGAKMDKEVPLPYFNHAVVAAELEKGSRRYLLMDPTNENTKDIFPAYLNDKSYLVCREEGETLMTTPVPSCRENSVSVVSSGKLGKDGSMVLESVISFFGINDTTYRGSFARKTPEERQDAFRRIVARTAAGAELLSADIEPKDMRETGKPVKARIVWRVPSASIKGESRIELSVPMVSKTVGVANWLLSGSTSLEKRKYPLLVDTTAEVRETLSIDLPDDFGEAVYLPPAENINSGCEYVRNFSVREGKLVAERRLAFPRVEFSPADYIKLRESIKRVEAGDRVRTFFALDRLSDADVEVVLNRREVSIVSPEGEVADDWVATNEVVVRVLTYAGKKNGSEYKFNWNPAWENLEILEAAVSNRNGCVYKVSPTEINVMDSGWVAAAPRYPAGRITVVNLPSVEIGSVISLRTASTVKDAPLPFYDVFSFDSVLPVRRKVVRVDGWRREVSRVPRIANEPFQCDGRLWRDMETVSRCDWKDIARILTPAATVPDGDYAVEGLDGASIAEIRNWMARHVKVCGPSLYDLPIGVQLTDPSVVLKERYATRLDYVRTLAALLKSAGYDADIVFAANDAGECGRIKNIDRFDRPNPGKYRFPLCRVRSAVGGFFGLGAKTKTLYLGIENEYTPIGSSAFDRCSFFDALAGRFGEIRVEQDEFVSAIRSRQCWRIRTDGTVDVEDETMEYGESVGAFRKRFAEMLPEARNRYHRSILSSFSEAAEPAGDFVTDIEGYPARTSLKLTIPEYATVDGDAISLLLPAVSSPLPALTGNIRQTPVFLRGCDSRLDEITVYFPEGYTQVEHLPSALHTGIAGVRSVSSRIEDGRLSVKIVFSAERSNPAVMDALKFSWLKAIRQETTSPAARTLTVRRKSSPAR